MRSAIALRRTPGAVCVGFLALTALAGVLVPGESWPLAWVRYREYQGEFAGRPVVMVPPSIRRETVPLEYHIQMTSGVCQIAWIDPAGQVIHYAAIAWRLWKLSRRDKIEAGDDRSQETTAANQA